jgi:hypothetical protein
MNTFPFLFGEGAGERVRVGERYEFEFDPKVEADRKIGGLWEELSGGKCLFVMVKDRDWKVIEEKMR